MGKPVEAGKPVAACAVRSLRCVHCRTMETPLWRSGPDGLKTLCNACGVRFKKGKLLLYHNSAGILTAIPQPDSEPVFLPPPPKKSSKKPLAPLSAPPPTSAPLFPPPSALTTAPPASAPASTSASCAPPSQPQPTVRKVASDASLASTVAKKVRARARRMNAGHAPGRYARSSVADYDTDHMPTLPSPPSSLRSLPAPISSGALWDDSFSLRVSSLDLDVQGESPYSFTGSLCGGDDFPDVACLGLETDETDGAASLTLPTMAADPSSAERFSCSEADSLFGAPDPVLVVDHIAQRTALVTLTRDHSRTPAILYHICLRALHQLCQRLVENRLLSQAAVVDFIRAFSAEHSDSAASESDEEGDGPNDVHMTCDDDDDDDDDGAPAGSFVSGGSYQSRSRHVMGGRQLCGSVTSRLLLQDRMLYEQAVDAFRAVCDCAFLAIFADTLLFALLEEDVGTLMLAPASCSPDADAQSCSSGPPSEATQSVSARA